MLTWRSLLAFWIVIVQSSCGIVNNNTDAIQLQCDITDSNYGRKVFQIKEGGQRSGRDTINQILLNERSILDRLTRKSCFYLEPHEDGQLYISAYQGKMAFVADSIPAAPAGIQEVHLEPYSRLSDNQSLQSQIDAIFCPSPSRSIYIRSRTIPLAIDLPSFGHVAGLKINALVSTLDDRTFSMRVLDYLGILDSVKAGPRTVHIQVPENVTAGQEFKLSLELEDLAASQIKTPRCTYIYDPELPELITINGMQYSADRYIEINGSNTIEFRYKSSVPLKSFRLSFEQEGRPLQESYPALQRPHNEWLIIVPKPPVSGYQTLTMEAMTESGSQAKGTVSVDFGDQIAIKDGINTISPGGSAGTVLIGTAAGHLELWDLSKRKLLAQYPAPGGYHQAVISPRRGLIALMADASTTILDTKTGEIRTLPGPLKQVQFDTNERIMLAIRDKSLLIIDPRTAVITREIGHDTFQIPYAALSSDGQRAAYMTDDRIIYALDLQKDKASPQKLLQVDNSGIDQFILSPSGRFLAYNSSEKTFIYDFSSGVSPRQIHSFEPGDGIRTLLFTQDDKELFMGTALGQWAIAEVDGIRVYPSSLEQALQLNAWFKGSIVRAAFSEDGDEIVISSSDGQSRAFSRKENILSMSFHHDYPPRYLTFSNDGLVIINDNKALQFHSKPHIDFIHRVNGPVNTMSVSPSGRIGVGLLRVTGAPNKDAAEALAIDAKSRQTLARVKHEKAVNSAEVSPDGRWLLTASEDNTAKLIHLKDQSVQTLSLSFKNGSRPVRKAMFSHSGTSLALVIHDMIFTQSLFQLEDYLPPIKSEKWIPTAGFSADDKEIFTSSELNMAGIYDVQTGELLAKTNTQGSTWASSLSRDGSLFASLAQDGYLRIDQVQRNSAGRMTGLKSAYTYFIGDSGPFMGFSPDSRYLGITLWSGYSYIWDRQQETLLMLPCARRGNGSAPAFSANSEFVTFGHNDKAYTYHLPELRPIHIIRHAGYVSTVAVLDDRIYSGSWDGTIKEATLKPKARANCVD